MLDTTFSPLAGADNTVYTMAWQPDGKVVAGGAFTHFNGFPNNYLTRVNIDGSLDSTNFFPGTGADDIVWNVTLHLWTARSTSAPIPDLQRHPSRRLYAFVSQTQARATPPSWTPPLTSSRPET